MINWQRAILAGVVAGIVFVMMEMLLVTLAMGESPWGPPRMMAAIIMGENVLPPPATFETGIVMIGMMLHLVLSVAYGVLLAYLLRKASLTAGLAIGATFGLGLYLINFYGFTLLFEWFSMARNWVTVLSHIAFGVVAASFYCSRRTGKSRSAVEAH